LAFTSTSNRSWSASSGTSVIPFLDMQNVLYPTYSSALDYCSATYAREVCLLPHYYYEALAFKVSITGDYNLWSYSDMNTYGYLYVDGFNPFQPTTNRLSSNDNWCDNGQFHIAHRLAPNTTYILVITTSDVNATGTFSVMSAGPALIQIVRLGQYSDCEMSNTGYWMMQEYNGMIHETCVQTSHRMSVEISYIDLRNRFL
jgi:hypothetical protein